MKYTYLLQYLVICPVSEIQNTTLKDKWICNWTNRGQSEIDSSQHNQAINGYALGYSIYQVVLRYIHSPAHILLISHPIDAYIVSLERQIFTDISWSDDNTPTSTGNWSNSTLNSRTISVIMQALFGSGFCEPMHSNSIIKVYSVLN